jgi:hypothetical protein
MGGEGGGGDVKEAGATPIPKKWNCSYTSQAPPPSEKAKFDLYTQRSADVKTKE